MSVTMATFDAALKEVYENPTRDQINIGSGAFAMKVEQTSRDIVGGRRVIKPAPYGVNGGTGSGSDTDALPISGGNKYADFISTIKSVRGVIQFTDQVMKASRSDRAAFMSAMQSEEDGMLKSLKHTYGRQMYMDGVGKLAATGITNGSLTMAVDSTQYLVEGQTIDIYDVSNAKITNGTQRRIEAVNRAAKTVILDTAGGVVTTIGTGYVTEQGSYNKEITGMEAVYAQSGTLYTLSKTDYPWLIPFQSANTGDIEDQKTIDVINYVEEFFGSTIDLIPVNPAVETEYYKYLEVTKRSPNPLILEGGYKALSIGGRPMTKDRFIKPGVMKLLDTTQWKMHTMDGGDWSWLDEDGKILKWVSGYAKWTAAMIKYCELICDHPGGQAELTGITTTSTLFS